MEKHAGCLKIHSDRAAVQKLAGPSWSAGAAQGTGMERAERYGGRGNRLGEGKVGEERETVEG